MNAIIIGTGKIGIDLYIKCLKSKNFKKVFKKVFVLKFSLIFEPKKR